MKEEKKAVAKELKNAQRRRSRLKHKARLLSQLDLLEVMNLRTDEERAKRPRSSQPSESSTAEPAPSEPVSSREDPQDDPEQRDQSDD